MARRRTVEVRESTEELQQLREYYAGTRNEALIHLLLLLKEDATTTIPECARSCGISSRKAERVWKAYREGGISGILDKASDQVSRANSHMVKDDPSSPSPSEILNLVGKVLSTPDVSQALKELRSLLYRLCPDVDYIALRMSMLNDVDERRIRTGMTYCVLPDNTTCSTVRRNDPGASEGQAFLEEGRRLGVDLSDYDDDPCIIDLFSIRQDRCETSNDYPVASLLFFSRRNSPAISTSTLDAIERIRPFLSAIVQTLSGQDWYEGIPANIIQAALHRMTDELGFTLIQAQVLLLSMFGKTYREVAEELSLAVSTIKSHLQAVYRILGVSSKGEAISFVLGFDRVSEK